LKTAHEGPPYALTLLDVPQKDKTAGRPAGQQLVSDKVSQDLQVLEERMAADKTESEPAPKRTLPWFIDIFLYPISKPGLTTLGIIVAIPLLFNIIVKLLGLLTLTFPPLLVLLALFAFVGFLVKIILYSYLYWYFCECIRNSATGELRAPETLSETPGLEDILWQLLRTFGCLVFFLAPMLIYFQRTRQIDTVFWSLLTCAVFFFPMGLLAVVMFDSFSGLNPILLIGSIFSTFFQYCGLVILFYGLGALFVVIARPLWQSQVLAYILGIVLIYLLIITAHLLGRFYWWHKDKLNWGL